MFFAPSQSKRNVVLALQIVNATSTKPAPDACETSGIARISALFCDNERITEGLYNGKDEASFLHRFWRDIRPRDRIFSANVLKDMTVLRERSWQLGVLPSAEIDLRCVYGVEMWDTEKMWATGYVPHVPYALHIDDQCLPAKVEHTVRTEPECAQCRD